jgi:hypothetical protein
VHNVMSVKGCCLEIVTHQREAGHSSGGPHALLVHASQRASLPPFSPCQTRMYPDVLMQMRIVYSSCVFTSAKSPHIQDEWEPKWHCRKAPLLC